MAELSPASEAAGERAPGAGWRVVLLQAFVAMGGAAALSWEVVWQTQASLAFGVSAVGTALTLAATMGGMALGSLLGGHWLRARNPAQPLRLYGGLEAVVGLSGLLMLPGFAALERLDGSVYAVAPGWAPGLHVLGVLLLLAPPTMAMGATVPVFLKVAEAFRSRVSILYAMNTAGAALGVLAMAFVLLPKLGVQQTCWVVAGVNLAITAACLALGRPGASSHAAAFAPAVRSASLSPRVARGLVFLTGFATFGLEVAWFRAMRSAFWSTSATFAVILAAVLLPLAVGARLVPWMRRRGLSPGSALAAAGCAVLLATPLIERLDLGVFVEGSFAAVILRWFLLSTLIVGPAVMLLATFLPWCLEEAADSRSVGQLYAFNTLGSVAGSLFTAWVLLPSVGFARSAWILGVAVALGSALVPGRASRAPGLAAAAVALALAVGFASSPGRDRMYGQRGFGDFEVVALDEGPDFTVSVVSRGPSDELGSRLLVIDGFGASSEDLASGIYMEWMGSLPVLLHPDPQRALVICFGTGRTANAVRKEEVAELDLVDVSASVFGMADHFPTNEGVLEDPRVRAVEMDGRAWLRRTGRPYDVITLEPMPPNFSGVNALYSRDFYEIAKASLAPGGSVAQWLPFHLVSPEHAAAIAATFVEVFPGAVLWIEPFGGTGILVGRKEPAGGAGVELGSAWPGLERRPVPRNLSAEQIREAVALDPERLAEYARSGDVITDDNQLLAWGQMRSGQGAARAMTSLKTNLDLVAAYRARPLFRLDPRTLRWDAPGPAGPRTLRD